MSRKTGTGLAAYAKAQLGKPYWWGTFGQVASAALLAQKRAQYPESYRGSQYAYQFGQRVHDCVGLIKGYRWSETPDSFPAYVASQDVAVPGLYAQCSRRGPLSTIPDLSGVCVFMGAMGHVGVYVGGGKVVEAMGQDYGVVQTDLYARGWAYWGMPDWIDYSTQEEQQETPAEPDPEPAPTVPQSKPVIVRVDLPLIRQGSFGAHVRNAQQLLIGHGYYCGGKVINGTEVPDGDFGPSTDKAVRAFQALYKLETDGIIGSETWAALLSV